MDRAQYNIRNLIEVVPFLKAESEFYGAVVLAIYFCEKYENAGAGARMCCCKSGNGTSCS